MSEPTDLLPISAFGEKRLIAEFVRPLFNREDKLGGVGDDCAMLHSDAGGVGAGDWLFSTDRVPADLTAFRLGILDHRGLGRYLACLNLSDIAACGGRPLALLLNLGLPADFPYTSFTALCKGFGDAAAEYGAEVLGGDMTWSQDISISATSIGRAEPGGPLTRRGARPGDSVFVSKAAGLTPAAFAYYLRAVPAGLTLPANVVAHIDMQFTAIAPEVHLGLALAQSGVCTACLDNTDGLGQSLIELAAASSSAIVVEPDWIAAHQLVWSVARLLGEDIQKLIFGAGADFALVGTLRGSWKSACASELLGRPVDVIGRVESGSGVWSKTGTGLLPLVHPGWTYFS